MFRLSRIGSYHQTGQGYDVRRARAVRAVLRSRLRRHRKVLLMPRGGKQKFDETGKRYARLRVLLKVGADSYRVQCDCGKESVTRGANLRTAKTMSCGCLKRESAANAHLKHGNTRRASGPTRTYSIWLGMRSRCYNRNEPAFANYGGRGIAICERWDEFASFLADMGEAPAGLSIDRINNNGNYEPGNCRWATPAEQSRNTRQNVMLTFRGKTQCVTDWADEVGIADTVLRARLFSYGWPLERALTTGSKQFYSAQRHFEVNGERITAIALERRLGLTNGAIRHRINSGWPLEKALTTPKTIRERAK